MRFLHKKIHFPFSAVAISFLTLTAASSFVHAASDTSLAQVHDLYTQVLGRDAEPAELDSWSNSLDSGMAYGDVLIALATSQEATDRLTGYYQTYLGRSPEPGAVDSYEYQLSQGVGMLQIENGIANSPEANNYSQAKSANSFDQPAAATPDYRPYDPGGPQGPAGPLGGIFP